MHRSDLSFQSVRRKRDTWRRNINDEHGTSGADSLFVFTVAYLTRIGNQSAGTLTEFLMGLEECQRRFDFHHTFQTLESHHFLTEGFSNDFAQWVLASANRDELAEQLAALDIRDYVSIAELRSDLRRVVSGYCTEYPTMPAKKRSSDFIFVRAWRLPNRWAHGMHAAANFAKASNG